MAARLARHLVSQNKKRFTQDGFDLDLVYLTDEIICMGLPAEGKEAFYRNPIDVLVRFFESRHAGPPPAAAELLLLPPPRTPPPHRRLRRAGAYKIFNLCNERSYDISKFGDACATFAFEDHGAMTRSAATAARRPPPPPRPPPRAADALLLSC